MAKSQQPTLNLNADAIQTKRGRQFTVHIPDTEASDLPSQTVPDTSMSIKEMLYRTARGLPINSGQQPIWNGEKLLPDWKKLDLIDRAAVVEKTKQLVAEKKAANEAAYQRVEKRRAELKEAEAKRQKLIADQLEKLAANEK